jgi:hypothetical protein
MRPQEYRAESYHLGHRFAMRLLGAGMDPGSVRRAMDRAQERLRELRAYSADMDEMIRRGIEDVLAGRPMNPDRPRGDAGPTSERHP